MNAVTPSTTAPVVSNSIQDLSAMIKQVGGRPVAAANKIQVNGVGSAKTQVWMDDVLEQKLILSLENRENIWMYGPAGVGKSTIAASVMEARGDSFYRIQGHSGFEAQDWYGGPQIDTNGKITVVYNEIVKAMEEGIPCIVEEFNMIMAMHKGPVFSMLDDTKFVDIVINGEHKRVKKHPGFSMIVTANDNGTGDMLHLYGGGERENQAIVSRFNMLGVGYLPDTMEMDMLTVKTGLKDRALLQGMVKLANETRLIAKDDPSKTETAISPRQMISWAKCYVGACKNKSSLNHLQIAEMILTDRLPESQQESVAEMVTNLLSNIDIHSIKHGA